MKRPYLRQIRTSDLVTVALPVTLGVALFSFFFAKLVLFLFGHTPDYSEVLSTFRSTLTPKPDQQLRYILILLLWPVLMAGSLFALGLWRRGKTTTQRTPTLSILIFASQILLTLFILWNIGYQESTIHSFFSRVNPDQWLQTPDPRVSTFSLIAALILSAFVLFSAPAPHGKRRFSERRAIGIAATFSILELLVCIIPEWNFSASAPGVVFHMPYTFDEFVAVANGRTLAVNYFPQYQQLLPYFFSPLFSIFGLNLTTYTVGLAGLTALVLGFAYAIIRRVTLRPIVALLLFLGWLGVAFFPMETQGAARYITFTYYPVGPLRMIGFWSVAYFTLRTVTGDLSFRNQFLCLFWASLAVFNSFDFGIPAWVACLTVVLFFSPSRKHTLLALLGGISTALTVYVSIPLIRTGTLPDIGVALSYLRAAGRVGYTSLNTPDWGYHWVFILGLLGSLTLGAARWWNSRMRPPSDLRERSLTAAFLFFGIAGSGAFSYFMNRSHWQVLVVIAPIAFFPLLLFTTSLFEGAPHSGIRYRLQRIPRILCLLFIASGLALLENIPSPISQWERIQSIDVGFTVRENAVLKLIDTFSAPGEKIALCYPFGQLLAHRAGVVSIFPYPQAGSLLLRSQFEIAVRAIEENQVQTLFGNFPGEFFPWMSEKGFRQVGIHGDFAVYQRAKP